MAFIDSNKLNEIYNQAETRGLNLDNVTKELLDRGHTVQGVNDTAQNSLTNKVKYKPDRPYGVFTGMGTGIKEAWQTGAKEFEEATKEGLTPQSALRAVGAGAKAVTKTLGKAVVEPVGKLIDVASPKTSVMASNVAKTVSKKIAESPTAQGVAERYAEYKKQNPEDAQNLESAGNIGELLLWFAGGKAAPTFGAGVKAGEKAVAGVTAKTAGKLATGIEKTAQVGLTTQRKTFIENVIKPTTSKLVRKAEVGRSVEVGKGLGTKTIITPSTQELKSAKELTKITTIKPGMSFQKIYTETSSAIEKAAKTLESDVKANDFIISRKEIVAKLNQASKTLEGSPVVVGDAQKTAQKLLEGAKKFINENPGTGSGLLQARKDFDAWVKSQKPKVFDAKTENAFTIANREIRDSMNNLLEQRATNVGVKESLSRQSSLYRAIDTIKEKAADEADTAIKRLWDNTMKAVGARTATTQTLATLTGMGGLGASAVWAPFATGGIAVYLAYRGGKLLFSPEMGLKVAKLLRHAETALNKIAEPSIKSQVRKDIKILTGFIEQEKK